MRPHKYGARATEVDGIKFPSLAEARYYELLKLMKETGEIVDFERQVPVALTASGKIKLVVDFKVYYPDGTWEYHEVKGVWTPVFRLKLALFEEFRGHETIRIFHTNEV